MKILFKYNLVTESLNGYLRKIIILIPYRLYYYCYFMQDSNFMTKYIFFYKKISAKSCRFFFRRIYLYTEKMVASLLATSIINVLNKI